MGKEAEVIKDQPLRALGVYTARSKRLECTLLHSQIVDDIATV